MWRTLGMIALALTGIGAIYMLARLQTVKPNCKGIIRNNLTGEYEELEPGIHCILSPFSSYEAEVSAQVQMLTIDETVKSKDNVDINIVASITYQITDPLNLYTQVANPDKTFKDQLTAALSSVLQTLNFSDVTSSAVNDLIVSARSNEKRRINKDEESKSIEDGTTFISRLFELCNRWGINISTLQIVTTEAKHKSISEALEINAAAEINAKAQLKAATAQAKTIEILANAEKQAQGIRAEGAHLASETLSNNPVAMNVYAQETQVRTAQALGNGNNNLLIDMQGMNNGNRLSQTGFAAFNNGKRPRSLSFDNVVSYQKSAISNKK